MKRTGKSSIYVTRIMGSSWNSMAIPLNDTVRTLSSRPTRMAYPSSSRVSPELSQMPGPVLDPFLMRIPLPLEASRRWSGIIWVLVVVCLLGCARSSKSDLESTNITGQPSNYPDSELSGLPSETIAKIESFSVKVAVPTSIPFGSNEELGRVYSEWYRKGYAFAFVTGRPHLRDWLYRDDRLERVKALGWFDGNSAGGLAKRLEDIESAMVGLRRIAPTSIEK